MKKIPWGIVAGVCAIVAIYLTIGIAVAGFVLGSIAAQTNNTATIFDLWWQILLFVVDIAMVLGFVGALTMWFLRKGKGKKGEVTKE